MIVILEDIWDQIKNVKVIKNDLSEQRIKTALRAFTSNYIDVDEKQIWYWWKTTEGTSRTEEEDNHLKTRQRARYSIIKTRRLYKFR